MTFSINTIIEQSEDKDHDLRQMALYDLYNELQKESFQLDEAKQRQISTICLKALDDRVLAVQAMSVKCLPLLLSKMSTNQMISATVKLSEAMLSGKDEKRDIATVALRSIIAKLPAEQAATPISRSVPGIMSGVTSADKVEIKLDAMEVLTDIIRRFGSLLVSNHQHMQKVFMKELGSKDAPVRKRAITALAVLSLHSSDGLFEAFVSKLLSGLDSEDTEVLRTYMQLLSSTSRLSGHRFRKHLETFIEHLTTINEMISEEEEEDELREYIVQTFEAFVSKCPQESKEHVELMLIICVEFLQHDPNYSYDTSGEDEQSDMDDEMESDDEGDYSDDDDISWKVRKAAAKCLIAMIKSHPDMGDVFFTELAGEEEFPLISRFKEREEQVKLDIYQVFKEMCNNCVTVSTSASGQQIITQNASIKYLNTILPRAMVRIKRQLKDKSGKVRLGCFQILTSIVTALQGGLEKYIPSLIPHIKGALVNAEEQDTQLKLAVLNFLSLLLTYHDASLFESHISDIGLAAYERANDKYYKVTAESLRVCSVLVGVLAQLKSSSHYKKNVDDLYSTVFGKLKISDIDQDVKEASIKAIGDFIATFGQERQAQIKEAVPILIERLKNEITRLVTCRAFETIAASQYDLTSVLQQVVTELANYLRKFNRPLRQASLITLKSFAKGYGAKMPAKLLSHTIKELTTLVNETDLHLAHLSLELAATIMESSKSSKEIQQLVLPKGLELLGSSTLQGTALSSLLKFFKLIQKSIGFDTILKSVLAVSSTASSRQIYTNVGKSVAALCAADANRSQATIAKFSKDLSSSDEKTKALALFTLGEIGKITDLSKETQLQKDIQSHFESKSEDIKNAASYCLGNIAIGNLDVFLPFIVNEIKTKESRRYLLIHSLKYILVQSESSQLNKFSKDLVPLLMENGDNKEEGVRNVVAECLGKLASVNYDLVLPALVQGLKGTEFQKQTVIASIKYTVIEKPMPYDGALKKDLTKFMNLLDKSEPVSVRRSCILLLTSCAHNKPALINETLSSYLPKLYAESVFDASLERVIDLGPFKHRVDDGLELRKSAFECMDTLLSACISRIEPQKFVAELPHGCSDKNHDIRVLSFLIVRKTCTLFPEELVKVVPKMVTPMKKKLVRKLKDNALQQEKERHEEMIKAAMKAIVALSVIPGIDDIAEFQNLLKLCKDDATLSSLMVDANDDPMDLGE